MRIHGEIDMIHKNSNLLDDPVKIPPLPRKPLYAKDLISNNNRKTLNNNLPLTNKNVVEEEQSSAVQASNDDNNNDYIHRKESIYFKCPVCHLDEFSSRESLDEHIKSEHAGFKPSCRDCGEMFASLKSLAIHSAMHVREKCAIRNSHLNLKILNYLENKNAFYQKLTDTVEASQSYKCNFCSEHFTGAQFMVHWKQCNHFKPDDLYDDKTRDDSNESDNTKSNFLAGLNLHSTSDQRTYSDSGESNRSSRTADSMDTSKTAYLMDAIQDVAASAAIAAASSFPTHPMFFVDDEKSVTEEEEDPFKLEVRDMKRRGEFPCRICKKIFRNLRALKGHARIHISGNRGIRPYECNICSFSTNDKSVIIRHIRNHNGDHPYKCQLCFSTFTTKANCERHLRNAHRKTSRDDIKKLLVDLNSKPAQNNVTNFKTKLQSLLTNNAVKEEKDECKFNPLSRDPFRKNIIRENGEQDVTTIRGSRSHDHEDSVNSNDSNNNTNSAIAEAPQLSKLNVEYPLNNLLESEIKYSNFNAAAAAAAAAAAGLIDMRMSRPERQFYEANYKTYNDVIRSTGRVTNIHRENSLKTSTPYPGHFLQSDEASDAEEPLDLSVDVLDLSKKKKTVENDDLLVEDLSVKSRERDRFASSVSPTSSSPSTSSFKSQPRSLFIKNEMCYNYPTPIVSNMPSLFGAGTEPSIVAFSAPKMPSDDEMVNTTRAMLPLPNTAKIPPLTFGQLVANAAECYEEIRHNMSAFATVDYGSKIDHEEYEKKADKAVANEAKFKDATPSKSFRAKLSTVKMVMKDGVLVEKQKQRRYRTEKPFSCAHCTGRFTLRSNMDRHVKQQHPGFWRQRQRGGSSRSQQRRSKNETFEMVVDGFSNEVTPTSPNEFAASAETSSRDKCHGDVDSEMEIDVDEDITQFKKCKKEEVNEGMLDDDKAAGEGDDDDGEEDEDLVIDEESPDQPDDKDEMSRGANATLEKEENPDLASVRSLLDNVSTQTFSQYFRNEEDPNHKHEDGSEDDEEGLVAGSSSEGNGSGGEEKSISDICTKGIEKNEGGIKKKKSAYSSAPNRVHCDFCYRSFPWASSLRRHTLTHTGQKPYKCSSCPLLFTTKSNCDRHFLRKHRNHAQESQTITVVNVPALAEGGDRSTSSTSPSSSARFIPNFSTRNVPDRPFKCSHCPSSTFSTFQNLKKHIIEKHNQPEVSNEESTPEELPTQALQNAKKDEHLTVSSEPVAETVNHEEKYNERDPKGQYDQSFGAGHVPSDLPFKCHLCDRSFGERQEALDHMSENHSAEFQHLIFKGALDMSVKLEDTVNHEDGMFASDENNAELVRGRFPDYSSRKVICAFCLRRFWSAEDLRRHMRTHTGERPFACDICQRRFTLKHSMLRHRKKHSNKSFTSTSGENSPNSEDEDPSSPFQENRELRVLPYVVDRKSESCASVKSVGEYELVRDADKDDSTVEVFCVEKDTSKMCNKLAVKEDGVDLIAKLLDIEDKELVDEMITSKSADDVAKLLGVQK